MRYRKRSYYPDDFYQGGSEVILRGEKYNTFYRPERYLEWFYGDWQTPRRTTDDYVTIKSRTNPGSLARMAFVSLFK